ncbi:MAG: hypothetical protein IJ224_06245 [Lachnospiraceae bacterium]|nr:hypothetical protein [Lachnospiraceae bacterium]
MDDFLKNTECDVMWKDEITGHISIHDGVVSYKAFTDNKFKILFAECANKLTIITTMQERVLPPCRCDEKMLKHLGLTEYNAYKILRQTHGVDVDDFKWLRFDGESLTWNDVKVRD